MAEPIPIIKQLSLLKTRTYPGYQFIGEMRYDGETPERCLRFVALQILKWLRIKIGGEPLPPEMNVPEPRMDKALDGIALDSVHINEGFMLDITSLISEGIWAMRLREPQIERGDKKAVVGRFFVTDIGLKVNGDHVTCGIRVNVLDPVDVTQEVDYAYRPGFLRWLFETKKLRITQVDLLKKEAVRVGTRDALKRLMDVVNSPDNKMPTLLFTYAGEQRKVRELTEKLDRALGLVNQPESFTAQLKRLSLIPDLLEFGNPYLPYDADYIAGHMFGYGRVYVIPEKQMDGLRRELEREIQPGDVVWIEPKCGGGTVMVHPLEAYPDTASRERLSEKMLHMAHRYSKSQTYGYDRVIFETAARRAEVEKRIGEQLAAARRDSEARLELLRSEADEHLREQLELLKNDYDVQIGQARTETDELLKLYDDEGAELKRQIQALTEKCDRLTEENNALKKKKGGDGFVSLAMPDEAEFYQDEVRDLILSVLEDAKGKYREDGSRAELLLEELLGKNEQAGVGRELFARLKSILCGKKNITGSDVSALRELGFEVSRYENNHYKLVFNGDERYKFTVASTSSENRGMKNDCQAIIRKLSVYK